MAHIEFVLEDEFQELTMAQSTGGRLLQPHIEGLHEAGETELAKRSLELNHGFGFGLRFSVGTMQ